MFEGENTVTFSKGTACKLFSNFLSNLLNSPVRVTDIDEDYKGVTINFTEDAEEKSGAYASAKAEVDKGKDISE